MKKLLICICLLCLFGCSAQSDIQADLDDKIAEALEVQSSKANNSKTFFSYYLEPSIGKVKSTQTSTELQYDGTSFLMNLNIAKIVNAMNYGDIIPSTIELGEAYEVAYNSGIYQDNDGSEYDYEVIVYSLDDTNYMTFDTHYVTFVARGNWNELSKLLAECMKIAKSIEIDSYEIEVAYSAKERISFEKQETTIVTETMPAEGKVSDVVEGTDTNVSEDTEEITSGEEYRTDNLDY